MSPVDGMTEHDREPLQDRDLDQHESDADQEEVGEPAEELSAQVPLRPSPAYSGQTTDPTAKTSDAKTVIARVRVASMLLRWSPAGVGQRGATTPGAASVEEERAIVGSGVEDRALLSAMRGRALPRDRSEDRRELRVGYRSSGRATTVKPCSSADPSEGGAVIRGQRLVPTISVLTNPAPSSAMWARGSGVPRSISAATASATMRAVSMVAQRET